MLFAVDKLSGLPMSNLYVNRYLLWFAVNVARMFYSERYILLIYHIRRILLFVGIDLKGFWNTHQVTTNQLQIFSEAYHILVYSKTVSRLKFSLPRILFSIFAKISKLYILHEWVSFLTRLSFPKLAYTVNQLLPRRLSNNNAIKMQNYLCYWRKLYNIKIKRYITINITIHSI